LPITAPKIPPNKNISTAPPTSLIEAYALLVFAIEILTAIFKEYITTPVIPISKLSKRPILPIKAAKTTNIETATLTHPFIENVGSITTLPLNPVTNTLFQNVETRGYN
jgi:hypothetical protein